MPFPPIKVTIFWSLKLKTSLKSSPCFFSFEFYFPQVSTLTVLFPTPAFSDNTLEGRNSLKSHLLCKTMKWMMKLHNQSNIHALWKTHYSHMSGWQAGYTRFSSFYRFWNQFVQKVNSETKVGIANEYIKTNKNFIQIFTFKK